MTPLQTHDDDEAAQPGLPGLPDPDTLSMGDKWTAGQFTGERLLQLDPERYRAICGALANGMGIRSISRAYRVSTNTVAAVRDREGCTIETLKQRLAADCLHGAAIATERLIEEVDLVKRETLPIVIGVLTDKAQLLSGQPTQIHGQAEAPQDWDAARQAIRQARGRTIDIPAETGLIPEDGQTKGEPAREPAPAPAELPEPMPRPAIVTPDYQTTDSQSPVSLATGRHPSTAGNAAGHDEHAPTRAPGEHGTPTPTRSQPGGGGGRSASDDAVTLIGSGSETFEAKETPL